MSQAPQTGTPNNTPAPALPAGQDDFASLRQNKWLRPLADALTAYILPSPKLLRGEEIQIEIHQAPYRNSVPRGIARNWWLILIFTGILMLLIHYLTHSTVMSFFAVLLPLLLFLWAIEEILHFKQWRLYITNRRTIIYVPDPRGWLLVDNVRLQAGKIQVIDTSFSPNPWWGLFQTWTGARDLIISLSGYEFKPNTAEVKGGLIFPDVMPQDITALEEIVFPKK